jgi:DnaJ-class molecular chaperone
MLVDCPDRYGEAGLKNGMGGMGGDMGGFNNPFDLFEQVKPLPFKALLLHFAT